MKGHSEEPFDFAQDKLRDEESRNGKNNPRFFASTPFQLRMTAPRLLLDEILKLMLRTLFLLILVVSSFATMPSANADPQNSPTLFRVCADPNNLPFSNSKQEGFENKIAELLAHEFNSEPQYTW